MRTGVSVEYKRLWSLIKIDHGLRSPCPIVHGVGEGPETRVPQRETRWD